MSDFSDPNIITHMTMDSGLGKSGRRSTKCHLPRHEILLLLSLLPLAALLTALSLDWPHNWDDFQRGFNGIAPGHPLLGYGFAQSTGMLKLAIHDPLLTLSNSIDYRHPLLSGVVESLLLMVFVGSIILSYCRSGRFAQALGGSLSFSLLIGLKPTFLPPNAYPLAFTALFLTTIASSLWFDKLSTTAALLGSGLDQESPGVQNAAISFAFWMLEQLAFVFYACNYVQSILFASYCLFANGTLPQRRGIPKAEVAFFLVRYLPFLTLSVAWRIRFSSGEAESISHQMRPLQLGWSLLKWSLGGTTLGGVVGMQPDLVLFNAIPLPALLLAVAYCAAAFLLIGLAAMSLLSARHKPVMVKPSASSTRNQITKPLILGLSITAGWCLPALSARYYAELVASSDTQSYVGSRFASLGMIIVMSYLVIAIIGKLLAAVSTTWPRTARRRALLIVLASFFPVSVLLASQNTIQIAALSGGASSLRLAEICNSSALLDGQLFFLPDEVFEQGVKTNNWLSTFPDASNDLSTDTKKRIAMQIFLQNSLRLC